MASTASTHTAAHEQDGQQRLVLEGKTTHAVDEGHDADIPSNLGYLTTEEGERIRRQSIAEQSRKSDTPRNSNSANTDIEKGPTSDPDAPTSGDSTVEESTNIVDWDGPNDPENPYNWPSWRRWLNCGLVSAMVFVSPLASSSFSPGVPQLMREFHNDSLETASFVVSVYLLGFAFGPLLMAPLSEIYGRVVIYHICNFGFVCFVIGCALAPSINALIVFRFLSGVFGSCSITNGGGTIADIVRQERRAAAMAGFTIGPLLGPIIGPVAGGFLADAEGWRWDFWLIAIMGGLLGIVALISMKESYAPILLQRKAERLRKETGNSLLRSKLDAGLSPSDYFKRGIVRPLKMLIFAPIVWVTSLYFALAYGYLYLMFTSITQVFTQYYGFSISTVGLCFIGLGVGSLLGLALYSTTSDRYIKRKAAKNDAAAEQTGGVKEGMKPEYRLPLLPLSSFLVPAGLFIYGWTAQYRVHWIAPIIGMAFIGTGNLIVFMALQLYLIDCFTIYAASALAANTLVRSVAGAVLPLAGLPMYARLGVGWGNSLLAFIALLFLPVAFLILKYGETLRKKYPIKNL